MRDDKDVVGMAIKQNDAVEYTHIAASTFATRTIVMTVIMVCHVQKQTWGE